MENDLLDIIESKKQLVNSIKEHWRTTKLQN